MKKVLLPILLSLAMFAGGYVVGGNFTHCKCGSHCACNPCNCNK